MKLFLARLGKIWKTLRQQGLFGGVKRIWKFIVIYLAYGFQSALEGDVLIIGAGIGDVGHYRMFTQAEEFNLLGVKARATLQDNPFLLRFAEKFKIFILVRPVYTEKIKKLIEEIKKQKKTIIFDTDDLVFDGEFMRQTESYQKMNALEKKQYEKGVGEEILKDPYVKYCSTTTTFLERILENYGKQVFLSTNKISLHELNVAENINLEPKTKNQKPKTVIKIGYFSGTMTHNKDFATISEPLLKIMEKYPQVSLVLVGPLEIESKLNKFKDRIIQSGLVSREKHYENLASVDINLVPSILGDPFSESKSELKFFEAGIVKVPSAAVANETFSGCITDGENGFLAKTSEEWFQKLEKLILDEDLRKSMGKKAYEKSLTDYTVKNSHNEEYYQFLKQQL
jgi:O-antigen biosynthesis protein